MNNEKVRYTYRTDAERLKTLKIKAIELDMNTNELIDNAVDSYLKEIEKHTSDSKKDAL